MVFELARNWWVWALRGVLAILFGIAVFFWPMLFWLAAVYMFAAYALVNGILAIVAAVAGHGQAGRWWALLLEGVAGIVVGVLTFAWPLATVVTEMMLLYMIAFQCIFTGVFEVVAAIRLRQHIPNEWALALSGILSVILGVAFVILPLVGAVVIAWWIAAYAIVFGALMLALAFRLRSLRRELTPHVSNWEKVTVP
jgi:uncharacterized membrane protein HdeD (DUF308 family)